MKKIISIILAISFLLGGCTGESTEGIDSEDNGLDYLITDAGNVVLPLTKYHTLNPLINNNESYFYFSQLIFEGLFEFDQSFQAMPKLAEKYEVNEEGKVTIKLREDVLWHDGEEFTSRDVKFTIDALKSSSDNIYSKAISNSINSNRITFVNIIDDHNLEIDFERLSPSILPLLTFPIVPEHGFDYLGQALEENFIPIGTGPFKFSNASRSKDIELTANEDYRYEKPRIDKIIGRVLDEDLLITSFEAGQIDITITSDVEWDRYRQSGSTKVIEFVSSDYEFLGFNFNNQLFNDDSGQAIRKAIVYGIDRQDIIENIYLGHASEVDIPLHPSSWFLSDSINSYGYNPDLSKEYLNNAGFKDLDGDGILEDENGNKLEFRYVTNPSNINRRITANYIKEDLSEIGIELIFDFDKVSQDEYSDESRDMEWMVINEKLEKSDFDIVQLGLNMSVVPDIGHLFHTHGGNNFINYSDHDMDTLLLDYESNNWENIANISLQKYLVDQLPYISLYYKNKAMLVNGKIIGELSPTYYNPYKGLENCFTTVKGH